MSLEFSEYDISVVAELTRRVNNNEPVEDLFQNGDDGFGICYMLHLAIEFDRLLSPDAKIRKQIRDRLLKDTMLIDEVMAKNE